MRHWYSQDELDELLAAATPRSGWDFSRMNDVRQPVPWDYAVVVARYLRPADLVLDIGTGGGEHLQPGGYFITQQVGERNMASVRTALRQSPSSPVIAPDHFALAGLRLLAFAEYDVEYVVCDIESLIFWLRALDLLHADIDGSAALASPGMLNQILAGNVDDRGFVTNEHRYLAIAQRRP